MAHSGHERSLVLGIAQGNLQSCRVCSSLHASRTLQILVKPIELAMVITQIKAAPHLSTLALDVKLSLASRFFLKLSPLHMAIASSSLLNTSVL